MQAHRDADDQAKKRADSNPGRGKGRRVSIVADVGGENPMMRLRREKQEAAAAAKQKAEEEAAKQAEEQARKDLEDRIRLEVEEKVRKEEEEERIRREVEEQVRNRSRARSN